MSPAPAPATAPAPAPVAVVGMSCRLSGDVSTLDDFWTTVSRSRDGWGPVPPGRFSSEAYYHPNPQKGGCFNQRGGYFLRRDLASFDAPFFQISEPEATAMDPQQRQLLECVHEALENAGLPRASVAGSNMGVFVGGRFSDYRMGTLKDVCQTPMFDATGNHQAVQAGRISYCFDLRGPCLAVDTACSSGLYALHSAVQSIRAGECESAVVAGCCLHLQPDDSVSMSMMGLFNDEGKTFAFDHRATSGFARGEGVACLILKPLDKALRDRDKVRSVVVASGTNQDGKTSGIAAPNGSAQERLMRDVYARAAISPLDTGFVEAHGTGTKAGDPIEAGAVHRFFGHGRSRRAPLYLGSSKTNFGHLENVSGLVSVIKATLMLERGFVLPNAGFERANDAIPLDQWHLKVPVGIRPWPKDKRFVSVNNFGFGGSNAHVVLEAAPPVAAAVEKPSHDFPQLVVVSGADKAAAQRVAARLGIHVEKHPEAFQKRLLRDMAYTLGERRSHLAWRTALVTSSYHELGQALNDSAVAPRHSGMPPTLAFAYTGQGAQWARMGHELLASHPVFAETMAAAEACLDRLGAGFSLLEELAKAPEASSIGLAHVSQPACTAVQLGLTALLASWGVRPSMVVGHSSGEIAAAHAAGALTLDDAMAVAYHRGRLSAHIKQRDPRLSGAMLAVGAGPAEVKAVIKRLGLSGATVACENSPSSVTVSGDAAAVDELAAELERQGCFHRKLRVDVAYHSPHMHVVADEYRAAIQHVTPRPMLDGIAFYSALRGRRDDEASLGPSYWVENLTRPVLFSPAMLELCEDGRPDIVVEMGPHSALEGPIKQIIKSMTRHKARVDYLPSLVRNKHATTAALQLAAGLFVDGADLDFGQVNQTDGDHQRPSLLTSLAPYPWSEHKYWAEARASAQHRRLPFARHDLLGRLEDAYSEAEPVWRNVLNSADVPWINHHRMQSLATFPLAGFLCMAVEAASQRARLRGIAPADISGYRLREVHASKALLIGDGVGFETVLAMRAYAEGTRAYSNDWDEFTISSWTSGRGWLEHCRGLIAVKKNRVGNPVGGLGLQGARLRRARATDSRGRLVPLDAFYSELRARGVDYSSIFTLRPDSKLTRGDDLATSTVVVPNTASQMPCAYETPSTLHAAFVDLFFQHAFAVLGAGSGSLQSMYMPSAIKEMDFDTALPNEPGQEIRVVAQACSGLGSPGSVEFSIDGWHDARAEPVIRFAGFKMVPLTSDDVKDRGPRPMCCKLEWRSIDDGEQVNGEGHAVNGKSTAAGAHTNGNSDANGIHDPHAEGQGDVVVIPHQSEPEPLATAVLDLISLRTGSRASLCPLSALEPSSSTRYICLAEVQAALTHKMTAATFAQVQRLLLRSRSVLWVTAGAYSSPESPHKNTTQGLLRTVRSESGAAAAMLDLDPGSGPDTSTRAKLILEAFLASDGPDAESEFAEQAGRLAVPRVVRDKEMDLAIYRETQSTEPYLQDFEQPGRRLKVVVGNYGSLDSIYWTDDAEPLLGDQEIEISVAATGMNFKDVVIAMGQVSSPYLGIECSGTVSRVGRGVDSLKVGDFVCAMVRGAYGTHAVCHASSAAVMPADMGFPEAASLPVIFSTAYYALVEVARMEAGEKILIHAASGGVGQAAIQLSQMIGADIYVTVGSAEKKQFVINKYGIHSDRVFYSRDADFGPALREATGGRGVDVVLNSLAGDLLRETWSCLAPFGRFVEIGKRDIVANTRLEMAKFDENCTFSSVDLTLVASERPKTMRRVLDAVMDLVARKLVQPIGPITVVGIGDVEEALRTLQSGKTTGKMIVSHTLPDQRVKATHRCQTPYLASDATFVIVGGTGGIGRSMARRMVSRGARHLVLLSRSGAETEELRQLVDDCKRDGASVHVRKCDASDKAQVDSLVQELQRSLPVIRGVIHAAMVLKDVLYEKMTHDDYQAVVRSKVDSAWNFHQALADHALDFFLMLSSVSGIIGNRGQAAYAAANTFLDALALHRRRRGLAGTSLNLAAVSDVGYLAQDESKRAEVMRNISGSSMDEQELLALVEAVIQKVGDCRNQCITGLDFADPSALPFYSTDKRFSHLRDEALASAGLLAGSDDAQDMTVSQRLGLAADAEQALEFVTQALQEKLGAILMIPDEVIAAQRETTAITAFGLDSLTAIELRNWIGKELQAHLQVLELLKGGVLRDLAATVLGKSKISGVWSKE